MHASVWGGFTNSHLIEIEISSAKMKVPFGHANRLFYKLPFSIRPA